MPVTSLIPGAGTSVDLLDSNADFMNPEYRLQAVVGQEFVEGGSYIHDHYTTLPDMIKLTGMVDAIKSSADQAADAWVELKRLRDEGAILKLVAEFGTYEECVIKSAHTRHDTRGLMYTLELQEIRRVGLGVGAADIAAAKGKPGNPAADNQPEVKTGVKQPVPVVLRVGEGGIEIVDDVLGATGPLGVARDDVVEITDEKGFPTGRFTLIDE